MAQRRHRLQGLGLRLRARQRAVDFPRVRPLQQAMGNLQLSAGRVRTAVQRLLGLAVQQPGDQAEHRQHEGQRDRGSLGAESQAAEQAHARRPDAVVREEPPLGRRGWGGRQGLGGRQDSGHRQVSWSCTALTRAAKRWPQATLELKRLRCIGRCRLRLESAGAASAGARRFAQPRQQTGVALRRGADRRRQHRRAGGQRHLASRARDRGVEQFARQHAAGLFR